MKIVLFDVDGTLAPSGQMVENEMDSTLQRLASASQTKDISLGIIGGGNYAKIRWQLGSAIKYFRYVFAECGSILYEEGTKIYENRMLDMCDRDKLNTVLKRALCSISSMPIILHGQQIDVRSGLVYISPPGMQATQYERSVFMEKDKELGLRSKLIDDLYECVGGFNASPFEIALGGSVGVAVYPKGWDKSQVLEKLEIGDDDKIYYFGDRTEPGGNDHSMYVHPRVIGVVVTDPKDTAAKITNLFLS